MDRKIVDYVLNSEKRIVSPIGAGAKTFEFLCMHFLTIAEAMGFETEKVSDQLSVVKEGQLETREQLDELIANRYLDKRPFQWEYDYLAMMADWDYYEFYGGGCFGPLTIAGSILGVDRITRMMIRQPEFVEDLVSYITDILIMLAREERAVGMDLFWIAEPTASLVSPKLFWKFSGQYIKKIYEAADATAFLHVCGDTTKHTKLLEQTGANVLSIDYASDIRQCLEDVRPDTIIMGNISPITLRYGSYDDVAAEMEMMLEYCRGYRNYVISTGCAVIEDTPEEHLDLVYELAENDRVN